MSLAHLAVPWLRPNGIWRRESPLVSWQSVGTRRNWFVLACCDWQWVRETNNLSLCLCVCLSVCLYIDQSRHEPILNYVLAAAAAVEARLMGSLLCVVQSCFPTEI